MDGDGHCEPYFYAQLESRKVGKVGGEAQKVAQCKCNIFGVMNLTVVVSSLFSFFF